MLSKDVLIKRLEQLIENRVIIVNCLGEKKIKEIGVNDLIRLETASAEVTLLCNLKHEILNGNFQE